MKRNPNENEQQQKKNTPKSGSQVSCVCLLIHGIVTENSLHKSVHTRVTSHPYVVTDDDDEV